MHNRQKNIPVVSSSMPPFDDYVHRIQSLWETRILSNMGSLHRQLECELQDYLMVPNFQLFVNGHQALLCAINALKLSGEVITTAFTFASTVHAIVQSGLKPVFCDIREDDYTLDVAEVEGLITEKTTAIMPVHVFGNICDVEAIEKVAKKHRLNVLYDAAHAFAVEVNDKGIGTFGDCSMFSFHATKVYHTIEGGGLSFQDESLNRVLTAIKGFGITSPETVDYVGGNAKMDEFRAAMGLCNLQRIDRVVAERRRVVMRYNNRLSGIKGIRLLKKQKGVKPNYAYYPIVLDGFSVSRDSLHEVLEKQGIRTRKYFYPLCNHFSCYEKEYGKVDLPVAEYVASRVLCLPLYETLEDSDIDYICDCILDAR